MRIGINLDAIARASNGRPFNDLLLYASDWSRERGLADPTNRGVATDAKGWPLGLRAASPTVVDWERDQILLIKLGGSQGGDFPGVTLPPESYQQPGRWEFRTKGTGTLGLEIPYADGEVDRPFLPVSGETTTLVEFRKPVFPYPLFRLWKSDPADPLVPLSFRPAGSVGLWNPAYTDPLRIFGILRCMNLSLANDSTLTDSFPDHYTWTADSGAGVPPEALGELSRVTGADLWVNVPDRYTDRLTRETAARLRDSLPDGRKVFVEWSNEPWNSALQQYYRILDASRAAFPGAGDEEAMYRYAATRAKAAHDIYADVFGEARIVRVLNCHPAYLPNAEIQYRQYVDVLGGPAPEMALCGYIGNYLGEAENREKTKALGVDGVRKALMDEVNVAEYYWESHRPLLDRYGVGLHLYEMGLHLRDGGPTSDPDLIRLFKAVADDPGPCFPALLRAAERSGAKSALHFSYVGVHSGAGFWPVLQWTGQPPTPRYKALADFAGPPEPPPPPRNLLDAIRERDALAADYAALSAAGKRAKDGKALLKLRDAAVAEVKAILSRLPAKTIVLLDGPTGLVPTYSSATLPAVKAADILAPREGRP